MASIIDKSPKEHKRTAAAFLVLFALSLCFPLIGAVVNNEGKQLPIAGSFDVLIATACFLLFIRLSWLGKHQQEVLSTGKLHKALQFSSSVPLLLLVLFFTGIKLNWEILLVGLAWRYWLFLSALPFLVKAFQKRHR
jgi:hypothetical protein